MGYQLWIASALRRTGYPVIETPGWQTRGNPTFNPRGGVIHHDAINSNVAARNAINLMIVGRHDLPGPLCNVWLDDDNDDTPVRGDPAIYVIAAGRCNHAGRGGWNGLSGNSTVWGVEARNSGRGESWSPQMIDAYQKVAATLAWGAHHGPEMICAHREWAPGRKSDPAGIDMSAFRAAVKVHLAPTVPQVVNPDAVHTDQAATLTLELASRYDIAGSAHGWPTLTVGSTGEWVRLAQGAARWITGEPLAIDGVYGPATVDVITRLQTLARQGNPAIGVDGVCGPQTWQVLRFFIFVKAAPK